MPIEEPDLLNRLRALEPESISEVHRLYYADLYRYAFYRLNDAIQAEDVAADALLALLEALHNGGGPRKQVRSWLMGVCANLVNQRYRQQYRNPAEVEIPETLLAVRGNPEVNAAQHEQHAALKAALEQLTLEQQQVIALRFGSELSLEATAEAMGKNANAIKALQFRALGALRRLMRE